MNSFFTPFKESILFKIIMAILLFFYSLFSAAQVDKTSKLFLTLKAKDSIIFERTFNKCEVEKLPAIITEDFEFYHDVAGIQNKKDFIKAVKRIFALLLVI